MLGALVYLNALHSPFIYDDYRTIVANGSITSLWNLRAIVVHDIARPLVNLSYAVDHQIWGETPFGFHLTSLLLHVLNVVLFFHVAWRFTIDLQSRSDREQAVLLSPAILAFTAATAFAVHPMMTEAVAYISGRSELLCATFFLLATLCTRRWMLHEGAKWYVLTVVFWLAAVLSKEIAAMYPVVLMCYGRLLLGGLPQERRQRLWRMHVPLFVAALVLALVRAAVFGLLEHPGALTVRWSFVLSEVYVIARYVVMMLIPMGQGILHDIPAVTSLLDPMALVGMTVIGALLVVAWWVHDRQPLITVGILWFLLLLVPSSLLVLLNQGELMAEHRVYLASCGLCLAAGTAVAWLAARSSSVGAPVKWIAGAALITELFSLSAATVARNQVWSDPVRVWTEASLKAPTSWIPRAGLGEALHAAGRHAEAVAAYQEAVRLRTADSFTYFKLGLCLAELGRFDEAARTFNRLQLKDPASTLVPTGLGVVSMMAGKPDLARQQFQQAIAQNPREIMARQWQAVLEEVVAKDPAAALRLCEEIHDIAPGTLGDDECIARNRAQLGPRHGGG